MKFFPTPRASIISVITTTILFFGPASLWAMSVVDQSFDAVAAGSNGGLNIEPTQQLAQTFTVNTRGWLVGIDLQVRQGISPPAGPLLVDIRPTVGGVPVEDDTLALANTEVAATDIPSFTPLTADFVNVDLSPFSLFVSPGEVLAIVLQYPGTGEYVWLAQFEGLGQTYPDGAGFSRRFSPAWGRLQPETDFGFRTLVAIPEPATIVLMGLGLVGLGVGGRRKLVG